MEEWFNASNIMVLGKKFRFFRESLYRVAAERRKIPEIIVVDETEIKTSQGSMYLWFTLDPYNKTLLGFSITKGWSNLECLLTFHYWFKCRYLVLSLLLSLQMQLYAILSYFVSVQNSPLSKGFTLYIERLMPLSLPSMTLLIFLVSLH